MYTKKKTEFGVKQRHELNQFSVFRFLFFLYFDFLFFLTTKIEVSVLLGSANLLFSKITYLQENWFYFT